MQIYRSKENLWIKDDCSDNLKQRIKGIMKIVKSLGKSDLLLKGVSETIENEVKEQNHEFWSMLLGTIGASLLGNM